jgi:transposase
LLQHPPYSPELSPYFFLFPELKKTMKYRWFYYAEEIEANSTRQLRAITKRDYQRCFCQWKKKKKKCIQAQEPLLQKRQDQLALSRLTKNQSWN